MAEERRGTEAVESVWDYPRPPRLERTERHLTVVHRGVLVAETRRAMRVLETSHPPVYYIPAVDVAVGYLEPASRRGSFCEFKGVAAYWNLVMGRVRSAWWCRGWRGVIRSRAGRTGG